LGHDPFLPEFAELVPHGVYDAELIVLGDDGRPDFPLVCERLLHRRSRISLALMIFDVLELRGRDLRNAPYRNRRAILEG
jgi:ATP-dependent DNA ligase